MNSKDIGAISIVAGTAIGAGMLGLPMVIGSLGFFTGCLLLLIMWALAVYSGLMLIEINLEFGPGVNFNHMTHEVLGRPGQLVATGSVFFLTYCLLVAYITGMGGLISTIVDIDPRIGSAAFAIVSGIIFFIGTNALVSANKTLFTIMLGAMILSFACLGGQLELHNLTQGNPTPKGLLIALPVLFTSFGFHASIPSVVSFVGEDKKSLVSILVIGSTIPGLCYAAWLMLSLGSATPEQLTSMANVDALVTLISGNATWLSSILSFFAMLALVTSFFGVSLGLFDLVAETFKRGNDKTSRAGTSALVFLPPLAASVLAPDGFIAALSHAGAALAIIAIFLPCIMVLKLRSAGKSQEFRAIGGNPAVVTSFLFGIIIIAANYL
ncbi:amino acid permease [Halodesulfovibrio marinisediminis]|uniref:Tyrosine-specific transport protein n=1 Tax=Halodesulfovibrio marinisediminis DSM 17456 TaxID=1121457 RepID=A0A1N6GQF4_9BACT|nr:aromatic amino acid transport family protein [Halodesulfovibrio marinisediminis]SIO09744.1 tyrosine-specific transport protein [Halodesulfovibrio marinisediminis DSM 17456]